MPAHQRAVSSVAVPHERTSVAMARHAFSDELRESGVPPDEREDAVLVLSELMSNAIRHASPLPGGDIVVSWAISDGCLHVEITDGGATTRPHAGVAAMSPHGGRGLDIVRHISAQWGVHEDHHAVTVWADVSRSHSSSQADEGAVDLQATPARRSSSV